MKLRARNSEAKCKALTEDKLLSGLFSHDIQQMHYEAIQVKVNLVSASKHLTKAHNGALVNILGQYSKAIKSNKHLLKTIDTQVTELMDKERDMLETQEDTVLSIKDAIDSDFESIIDSREKPEPDISVILPVTPDHDPSYVETKPKQLKFGNVIIKTIDQAENEKHMTEQTNEDEVLYCDGEDSTNNENEENVTSVI